MKSIFIWKMFINQIHKLSTHFDFIVFLKEVAGEGVLMV